MPVTKRPDTGHYQVVIGHGGRTHRKTSRYWSLADARAYERRYLAALKDAEAGKQPDRLIADALEKWLMEHVPRLKSARQTRNHCRALLPYIHGRKLAEIPQVWAEVRAAEVGKAPATVNHKGRILRQIGRAAWQEWRWIDHPPTIRLLAETPRERFLSLEEVDRLAAATGSDAAAGYVLLAAYTGIRWSHMLRLTSHDVDGAFITLDRTGKTRILQRVPLHPRIQPIAARLPLGIAQRQLRDAWTVARKETGIDCRWHDLRHTCASWLVQAGVPLYTVGTILGHSSPAMMQRYAHLADSNLTDAMARIA